MKKILVGMSGGVDSSAAALILLKQGYDVTGCTLKLFEKDSSDVNDAKEVCSRLGIGHIVAEAPDLFRTAVMEDFVRSYENGGTPNPCIICNREIKFGAMLDYALENGFDGIATGHYARIEKGERCLLKRADDIKKDQSYFLYRLTQRQLAHSVFPLFNLEKPQIRQLAEENGLITARKRDSQDICFIPGGDYVSFIKGFTGHDFPIGDFIDVSGNVIGKHQGIINYTVGQRKGLGVTFGKPVYVCDKDAERNTVTLGDLSDIMTDTVTAADVNFISVPEIKGEMRCTAKVRYNMKDVPCTLKMDGDNIKVIFDEAVKAVTKGQALVCYDGDSVICGGQII
ncbi:MAG: tRNA 2-thiouridine(34) synthase MnmA [Oscillospiraceae bacterium]|nr:tRNA 2-thiouridine(34) synthase MnmA [Oscillospiraceae bacterium]